MVKIYKKWQEYAYTPGYPLGQEYCTVDWIHVGGWWDNFCNFKFQIKRQFKIKLFWGHWISSFSDKGKILDKLAFSCIDSREIEKIKQPEDFFFMTCDLTPFYRGSSCPLIILIVKSTFSVDENFLNFLYGTIDVLSTCSTSAEFLKLSKISRIDKGQTARRGWVMTFETVFLLHPDEKSFYFDYEQGILFERE